MKIVDVLNNADKVLKDANIVNSFYEARILLEYVLDKSKEWIMVHINERIEPEAKIFFDVLVKKRVDGIPLQYIIGKCGFMGNEFFVSEAVLIPRSDTEVWVEKVIELARIKKSKSILDLCTGSGCIAISLKKALNNVDLYAVDISDEALEIAKKNAEYNNVEITFYKSDLFSNLSDIRVDIIVSNPPYIPDSDIKSLDKDVLNEPYIALAGGVDGLDFYRRISRNVGSFLNDDGYLVFEFGYNQSEQVIEILEDNNFKVLNIIKDYSGNTRAVVSQKRG